MATGSEELEVEAETDRLYQGPLDGFVDARNALAARLKAGGDKDGAARVKALVRPNLPAWAANQVYGRARGEFDSFVAAVAGLRNSQLQDPMGGAALREAMKARREAQDRVLRTAASILVSAGHGANPSTLLRVSNTLEALAAAGASAPTPGRLAQDLQPPGFDTFAAGTETSPRASRPAAVFIAKEGQQHAAVEPSVALAEDERLEGPDEPRPDPVEPARAALAETEKRLERARREAKEGAGALSVAEKRAQAARDELEEAKRRLERAHERAALTAEDEAAARRRAGELATLRDAAEADRDAALRALRAVE